MIQTFSGETIEYEIVYKNRKSIGISIDYFGLIKVNAPRGSDEETIKKAIESKWEWILETKAEIRKRDSGENEKTYEPGEKFLYLGKHYPIFVYENTKKNKDYVILENDKINVYVKINEEENTRKALKRFYYKKCKSLVESRIKYYQSNFKIKPRLISITDDNTNWGTCNSNIELTFNWKLAMAPQEVIDYVVVHEMCHMVHLNHDRSFWRLVGKILPDYEKRISWLALSMWKMQV